MMYAVYIVKLTTPGLRVTRDHRGETEGRNPADGSRFPKGSHQGGTMSTTPIADYALISDCHSAALVSRDGSVDWCCFDRFDARPVFARLLDWSRGGHFRIGPRPPYRATRRYLPGTNILETRFETDRGSLVLTD